MLMTLFIARRATRVVGRIAKPRKPKTVKAASNAPVTATAVLVFVLMWMAAVIAIYAYFTHTA